jgi:hypothetical protein
MSHCVGTYGEYVKKKERQIIGVVDKNTNEMVYTIDIRKKKIVQFLGKRNSQPESFDHELVTKFLQDKSLIYKE